MTNKNDIQGRFSADPDRYYKVRLFEEQGFVRRSCTICKRFFWALDGRDRCPDHSQDVYSFIGDPPTSKRFDYSESWVQIADFFKKNDHTQIGRYPVVCRWRDDLYFTIASIVDFQRKVGSNITFEFPANPLIVPQTCLRFKDMENVGATGRHFSSFCMIGQHSIADSKGYWKDECINLDYLLLTDQFGIKKEEIVFVEDVWEGGGSFGSSLEYFVRGLELGNAVFTEFQGSVDSPTTLDKRIIDMGAGLERFAWITMGTPTAYDCCFGSAITELLDKIGCDLQDPKLVSYFTGVAKNIDRVGLAQARKIAMADAGFDSNQIQKTINPLEDAYTVADHIRTLVFAISDGALPSNVGGGYNLRMLLRRAVAAAGRIGIGRDFTWLVDSHIDYLVKTYPELTQTRDDVKKILNIETGRYDQSKERMEKIARSIKSEPSTKDLVRLYESDGITPDYLLETNVIKCIPEDFYSKLSDLHQSRKLESVKPFEELRRIPDTKLVYYTKKAHDVEFEAKVLKVINGGVILDKTNFYARGGGQEPDFGTIDGYNVTDVTKHGRVVIHSLKEDVFKEGKIVKCCIDMTRRKNISIHHTCTHILNASARKILGSWIWQHSAFKEDKHARLDITHHSALSEKEISQIETEANSVIRNNLQISINEVERGDAEQEYGFRIYQGGVVPVNAVRIVKIEGIDVEACGGTHISRTGDAGLLKIIRTERIQDGVVRLEFVAGSRALEYMQKQNDAISNIAHVLGADRHKVTESVTKSQEDAEYTRRRLKHLMRRTKEYVTNAAIQNAERIDTTLFYGMIDDEMDAEYHIMIGQSAVELEPNMVYCALIVTADQSVKIVVYCGKKAQKTIKAGVIVKEMSKILGGFGGGSDTFAQGGSKNASRSSDAIDLARKLVFG
ncbi:MAG: Alanyl-tRNA synthetase [Cenarchaeum symbiont of Oopsacas minuta]|nr:Alanyl-tRNA synthetase [Cenarchaeum symbiont of Oopsacas minuta]